MPSEARACAYRLLRRVFERGAYADIALRAEAARLDGRDRALAMRIGYGAVQRRGTLDHFTELLAGRPPGRLDPAVLAALRGGLYELLYLRSAPDHAVVADTVELVKQAGSHGHGLVNAVMRRAAREREALLAGLSEETAEQAALMHSHPPWLARLWWEQLGAEDARALMAADNEAGETALRVNTLVAEPAEVARELGDLVERDPRIPEALVLRGPLDLHASPLWSGGAVLAQSRAAMLVSRLLEPGPGQRVLDLCAGPGGKSTHLAALTEGSGEILAVESNPARAGAVERAARRLHAPNVRVELGDAAAPRGAGEIFDRVLVDPPCSGLGTLQARPDLRWRIHPEDIPALARRQAAILDAGVRVLRPGGLLVYSTCTVSAEENQARVESLLAARPDMSLDDLGELAPELRHPQLPSCLLTLPHRDRTAGFFIARLRRAQDAAPARDAARAEGSPPAGVR